MGWGGSHGRILRHFRTDPSSADGIDELSNSVSFHLQINATSIILECIIHIVVLIWGVRGSGRAGG